jgi:hypothetical protein
MPISLEELKKQGEIKTIYHPTVSLEDLQKQGKVNTGSVNVEQKTPEVYGSFQSPLGQFASSAGNRLINVVKNASSLGEKILQAPMKLLGAKFPEKTSAETLIPKELTQPIQTPAGRAGGVLGDVLPFFLPGGQEATATKGIDAALDTAKILKTFGKNAPLVTKLIKTAAGGLVSGTSMAVVTALEGGNKQETKNSFIGGSIAGSASKAFSVFAPDVLQGLAKSSFKLSPSVEAKVGAKADTAAKFVSNNNLSLSPKTQYTQLSNINDKLESNLQKSLGNKFGVSPEEVKTELNKVVKQFENDPAVYQEVKNDVSKAIKTLDETKESNITLGELLSGKRSYGKSAFGKSSALVKTAGVVSEGDYAIEQAYQTVLESALKRTKGGITVTPDIKKFFPGKTKVTMDEFNKVYSAAINAKKFANASQFKKDTQLVGRLFGLWAGEAVGNSIAPGLGGRLMGGMTGEVLSNKLPSLLRKGTAGVFKNPNLIKNSAKLIQGVSSKSN